MRPRRRQKAGAATASILRVVGHLDLRSDGKDTVKSKAAALPAGGYAEQQASL